MRSVAHCTAILTGQTQAWKEFVDELQHKHRSDFAHFLKGHGVSRVRMWIDTTPKGDMSVILLEGDRPELFLAALAKGDDRFSVWYKAEIKKIHGLDLNSAHIEDRQPYMDFRH